MRAINMEPGSIMLLIGLIREGVGVATEIKELADRVANGETITDEDISSERDKINDALSDWNNS